MCVIAKRGVSLIRRLFAKCLESVYEMAHIRDKRYSDVGNNLADDMPTVKRTRYAECEFRRDEEE